MGSRTPITLQLVRNLKKSLFIHESLRQVRRTHPARRTSGFRPRTSRTQKDLAVVPRDPLKSHKQKRRTTGPTSCDNVTPVPRDGVTQVPTNSSVLEREVSDRAHTCAHTTSCPPQSRVRVGLGESWRDGVVTVQNKG